MTTSWRYPEKRLSIRGAHIAEISRPCNPCHTQSLGLLRNSMVSGRRHKEIPEILTAGGCQLPRLPQLGNKSYPKGGCPYSPLTPTVHSRHHSPRDPLQPRSGGVTPLPAPPETSHTALEGPLRSAHPTPHLLSLSMHPFSLTSLQPH